MSIKVRVTLLSMITTLVVAGILLVHGLISKQRMEERVADAVVTGNQLVWEQLVENERRRIATYVDSFNNEFELRTAIKQKSPADIKTYADRYVNLTRSADSYDLLQIFDPEQGLLYSSSEGVQLQGIAALLRPVLETNETRSATLASKDGEVFNVVAFSSKTRRRTLGAALFAQRLDVVMQHFAQQSGFGVALAGRDGTLHRGVDFPEFGKLQAYLPEPGQQSVQTASHDGLRYVLSMQPIVTLDGNPAAHLLVARDDTVKLSELEAFTWTGRLLALAAILAGLFVLFFALRHYLAPLQRAAATASRIADGDLTEEATVSGVAEIRVVEQAMLEMQKRLQSLLAGISDTSTRIRDSAGHMTENAIDTQQELNAQEEKVDRVSLSLTQLASAIEQIAKITEEAAAGGSCIQGKADEGVGELQRAADIGSKMIDNIDTVGTAITGLSQHVEAVTGIVNVINSIAEQTNLLALNAAIEAARAGEQGRGFAVVADEVRSLASRTQDSTQEIESIIRRLQDGSGKAVSSIEVTRECVHDNAEQVTKVMERFDEIKQRIASMVGATHETASAVEQQSAAAKEVSDTMDGIRASSERSSARADTLLGTSESLDRLSVGLEEITGRFRYRA